MKAQYSTMHQYKLGIHPSLLKSRVTGQKFETLSSWLCFGSSRDTLLSLSLKSLLSHMCISNFIDFEVSCVSDSF